MCIPPAELLIALRERLERMTAEPGWLTFYMQKAEAKLILDTIERLEARVGVLEEALNDTISTIAAVRATATTDEWAESADHFHTICGETLVRVRAAANFLATKGAGDE